MLVRAPFRITFAYAGPDRRWIDAWRSVNRLPDAVRVTVRDAASERVLAASTAVRLNVAAAPPRPAAPQADDAGAASLQPNPGLDDAPSRQDAAPRSANGGFVLVAVLWMVAALATLASIYSIYATSAAAGLRVGDDRLQAELSIRTGVELAAYQLLALPEPARPTHGGFAVTVGRSRVAVEYRAETARIDLNAAPKELLAGLFRAIGAGDSAAQTYAERVVGWRTKVDSTADNPEQRAYASAGLAYRPRQAPFEDTLELALVLGLPQPIVERALPLVTVFSGRARVDVAGADPMTLAALPGMTPEVLHAVLKARAKSP